MKIEKQQEILEFAHIILQQSLQDFKENPLLELPYILSKDFEFLCAGLGYDVQIFRNECKKYLLFWQKNNEYREQIYQTTCWQIIFLYLLQKLFSYTWTSNNYLLFLQFLYIVTHQNFCGSCGRFYLPHSPPF